MHLMPALKGFLARYPDISLDLRLTDTIIFLVGLENWIFEPPAGHLSIKTKGSIRTDHGEAVRDACANGLGIAMRATWCVYQHLERGKLVQILRKYPLVSEAAI